MLLVLLSQRLAGRIALEVVIPIRQAEPGLIEVDRIAVRRLGVGIDPEAERGIAAEAAGLGEGLGQGALVADPVDLAELGQQRGRALGVSRGLIQVAAIEIVDLLGRRPRRGRLAVQPFHQHPHIGEGLVPQQVEGAVGRPVVRDLGRREPVAVHVAEEVITGLDPGVHVGQREAGVLACCVRRLTTTG
ncbi:hypothetical protein D3C79_511570 [compost metagenome]